MRWQLRLSHGNQEIHSMAIISQDTIKLGCSGSQGKIQIQTFFLGTPPGKVCHPTFSTVVENPLALPQVQISPFFCKTKPIYKKRKCAQVSMDKRIAIMNNAGDFRKSNPIKANVGGLGNLFDHIEILVLKTKLKILILRDRLDILLINEALRLIR